MERVASKVRQLDSQEQSDQVVISMEPSSRSLYVTLLSNTSKPEFPNNTPASFKVRLPYPLRVKNWQVGVAGVYLPEIPQTKPPAAFDIN